jgi:hypothetical protein
MELLWQTKVIRERMFSIANAGGIKKPPKKSKNLVRLNVVTKLKLVRKNVMTRQKLIGESVKWSD